MLAHPVHTNTTQPIANRRIKQALLTAALIILNSTSAFASGEQEQIQLQQQAQNYAICAALGNETQQQQFIDKMVALLQKNMAEQKIDDKQLRQVSLAKITQLRNSYMDYSPQSRSKLFDKVCSKPVTMDENFIGLQYQELPSTLQDKISTIASCALLSDSFGLKQQAKQLTAANTLIMIAAGLNGRNQALNQLTILHTQIIKELKTLPQEQIKGRFEQSCHEVQAMQNQSSKKQ